MPNQELPDEAIASLAPDLAVEVLSPSNTEAEMVPAGVLWHNQPQAAIGLV